MESPTTKSSEKMAKSRYGVQASGARGVVSNVATKSQRKFHSWASEFKYELKERNAEKYKAASQGATAKDATKPRDDFKLHTQERAIKRALFNYMVATKLYLIEQQKRQIERLQKIMEEEEIRMLRKAMIPRAQLMPIFDRPFFPQRSNRPLTVPREQVSRS